MEQLGEGLPRLLQVSAIGVVKSMKEGCIE